MMRQVIALFDEYQSKKNAKHVLRSMKENARHGYWSVPGHRSAMIIASHTVSKALRMSTSLKAAAAAMGLACRFQRLCSLRRACASANLNPLCQCKPGTTN
jgi:hypothetical protein